MATTPTSNPIPSEKPQDLKFNAGKIDEFVNSKDWTNTDRFGVSRYTIEGMNYLAQQVMAAFGYVTLQGVSFTTGATLTSPNEVLFNSADSSYYKWTGSFASGGKVVPANSTPASSGGIGAGKWLNVGDSALRSDLATPTGVNLVGGAAKRSGDDFTGPVSMTKLTVKSPTGEVIIGDVPLPNPIWSSPDSLRDALNVSRNLADTPLNCHAFADKTVINGASTGAGYGAFDSTLIIYGAHNQDHAHSFQDRISYQGTTRLGLSCGFYSMPTISGAGTLGDRRGAFVGDVVISGGGKLEQQTGIYVEDLKNATQINVGIQTRQSTGFAIYAPGGAPSYLKGNVGIGVDSTSDSGLNFPLVVRNSSAPTGHAAFISTDGNGTAIGTTQDVAINFIGNNTFKWRIHPTAASQNALAPGNDNLTPIGTSTNRVSEVHAGTGTINTSDGREKTDEVALLGGDKIGKYKTNDVLDAWGEVSIVAFKWIARVNEKGNDARWHFGAIAQQVRDAFLGHGIDATKFGLLCHDEWGDVYEPVMATRKIEVMSLDDKGLPVLIQRDEQYETGEKRLSKSAGDRWGLRHDQCAWLEAAYQRRRADRIEERISALEAK